MAAGRKRRDYRSPVRRERAAHTRQQIVTAARELFIRNGYGATSVAAIAARAGVSVDTVYASAGRKPELARAVIDQVLGGPDGEVPAPERDYVRAIRAAPTAQEKLGVYATALARVLPEVAPLQEALSRAGEQDEACRLAWQNLVDRRAANMLELAADLRGTGALRSDLTDEEVADIIWATNAAEFFLLLRQRGWRPDQVGDLLADLWTRVLLR